VPAFREKLTDAEERLGADIVMKSLRAPARLIAENAGVEGEVIVQKLLGQPFEVGYNAMTDTVENLLEAGVIDPAKVRGPRRCAKRRGVACAPRLPWPRADLLRCARNSRACCNRSPATGS
jgi:hypothetical protein